MYITIRYGKQSARTDLVGSVMIHGLVGTGLVGSVMVYGLRHPGLF